MRTVWSPLLGKEIRQNLLVYLAPLPILLLAVYLRGQCAFTGQRAFLDPVFNLAVPLALAVALGLQAFDVEVDARTRDFLLVKPLSLRRIIGEKFLLGWAILLCWSVLLIAATHRAYLTWPRLLPVSTWLGGLILCWATLVYAAAFFVGSLVRGPKKMLAASVAGGLAAIVHFLAWSSWATFAAHRALFVSRSWLGGTAFYLVGLGVLLAEVGFFLSLAAWLLRSRPGFRLYRGPVRAAAATIIALFLALGLNFGQPPPLRGATLLGLELFDLERPFWASEAAWRPGGEELAVAGPGNIIGLARLGGKPRPAYRGGAGGTIADLAWSPDGRFLAFTENGWVCVLAGGRGKPARIGRGAAPYWARTSDRLLYAAAEIARPVQLENGSPGVTREFQLREFDLRRRVTRPHAQLRSLSPYWSWDSLLERFLVVDAHGVIHAIGRDGERSLPLPSPNYGVTWHRFYPLPGKEQEYLLAVVSVHELKAKDYDLHVYRFDARAFQAAPVREFRRLRLGQVCLDPATGRCLLGYQGTYRYVELYK